MGFVMQNDICHAKNVTSLYWPECSSARPMSTTGLSPPLLSLHTALYKCLCSGGVLLLLLL